MQRQCGATRSSLRTLPTRQGRLAVGKSRRAAVRVVAFTEGFRDSAAVPVRGVTYYNLLQLSPQDSPQAECVRAAFESLVTAPTQATYSADTLFSRAVLLKSAAECLANADLRRSYDHKLSTGLKEIKVSQTDLPGALVLLQETGEYEVTIQLANRWLKSSLGQGPEVPDVATCLALALCDRAGALLAYVDGSTGQLTQAGMAGLSQQQQQQLQQLKRPLVAACEDLEQALRLCEEHDVAHALQDHIKEALEGYAHLYAVQLLSLPRTPEYALRRARGMSLFKERLNQTPPADMQERKEFLTKVNDMASQGRAMLTAAEQIALHKNMRAAAALAGKPATGVAYDVALAYIAEGCAQGWAHYMYLADQLLADVERDGLKATDGAQTQSNVSLERACCSVLLADWEDLMAPTRTLTILGLAPGSTQRPDPEIKAFIKANTVSNDENSGVKVLTTSWLAEAVLSGFREWTEAPDRIPLHTQSLQRWSKDKHVTSYCKAYGTLPYHPLLAFLHMLHNLDKFLVALHRARVAPAATPNPARASKPSAAENHECGLRAALAHASATRLGLTQQPEGVESSDGSTAACATRADSEGVAGERRSSSADVPEHPVVGIQEVVGQADTLTVDQLVARLPRGLMPRRRNKDMTDEQAAELASQRALRQQLDQMEKAMWEGKPGPHSGDGPGPALQSLIPRLMGAVALVAAVVAAVMAGNRAGYAPAVAAARAGQGVVAVREATRAGRVAGA